MVRSWIAPKHTAQLCPSIWHTWWLAPWLRVSQHLWSSCQQVSRSFISPALHHSKRKAAGEWAWAPTLAKQETQWATCLPRQAWQQTAVGFGSLGSQSNLTQDAQCQSSGALVCSTASEVLKLQWLGFSSSHNLCHVTHSCPGLWLQGVPEPGARTGGQQRQLLCSGATRWMICSAWWQSWRRKWRG